MDQGKHSSDSSHSSQERSEPQMRKTPSITSLIEHNRQLQAKGQGPWGPPSAHSSSGTRSGRRSGRLSAPIHKSKTTVGMLRPDAISSYPDESSSTDDESSSASFAERAMRPVTPPKPSILRQIRRSSTSQVVPNTVPKNHELKSGGSNKPRRLWDNFELRSSKSEYNLNFVGRDNSSTPSRASGGRGYVNSGGRLDLTATNPKTVDLNRRICEEAVDQLNFMSTYVRKLLRRATSSGQYDLTHILSDGVNRAYQNLTPLVPPHPSSGNMSSAGPHLVNNNNFLEDEDAVCQSLPPETMAHTMNLLQEYSDRLLTIVESRMSTGGKQTPADEKQRSNHLSSPTSY